MSRWDEYRTWYAPSIPRAAKGGIKAQSKHGAFAKQWWAKRWIAVLESFHIGARLQRGRRYARKGQVLSIDIGLGKVKASVQGSRAAPYKVSITTKTLPPESWQKVATALSEQAIFAAKLLAGELPPDIEDIFTSQGLSLFPARLDDLVTDCSCPDWSNPCKHIAAVYYLLGEEFDRDPFLILKLRGIEHQDLLDQLGASTATLEPALPPEPLPTDAASFWNGAELDDSILGEVDIPRTAASLPRRLGKFPLWRGEAPLLTTLEETYEAASPPALDIFL
ncbi:MAG: hypothetical protein GY953_34985 [bacterium]|nr:hypothetical protein [bacterium]